MAKLKSKKLKEISKEPLNDTKNSVENAEQCVSDKESRLKMVENFEKNKNEYTVGLMVSPEVGGSETIAQYSGLIVDDHKLWIEYSEEEHDEETIRKKIEEKKDHNELLKIELMLRLTDDSSVVVQGSLKQAERMLITQAKTLDVIFNNFAQKAAKIPLEDLTYLKCIDGLLRLSFKAQSQCRATLETLANIKNPPNIAFVKQQNVANQQQINNNQNTAECDRTSLARENKNVSNKLLERKDGQRLDFGKKAKASGNDSELEALGSLYRPKNGGRKSKGKRKRP